MPPDATRMVEAEGIHKFFGNHHVLRGLDLTVQKGEVVVIVGPSGQREEHVPAQPEPPGYSGSGHSADRW